jgi:ribosome-associated protein
LNDDTPKATPDRPPAPIDPPAELRARRSGRRAGLPAREALPAGAEPADAQVALALARQVVDVASDKKAADIIVLSIAALTTVADYLVICSGASERQLGAIADGIVEELRESGVRPIGREGAPGAHWILLDLGSVVVHVFAPPERDFYQLERLWSDAPTILHVQ